MSREEVIRTIGGPPTITFAAGSGHNRFHYYIWKFDDCTLNVRFEPESNLATDVSVSTRTLTDRLRRWLGL
jgi:hypothetical protein